MAHVSRETEDRLRAYAALIERWTPKINLISRSTIPEIWTRHILDSVQIVQLAPENWSSWTDLGSGGGLPGCVAAILAPEDSSVTLVESDQRKAAFLRTVQRELDLPMTVLAERIEAADVAPSDVVSARALAALPALLQMAEPLLKPDGLALFPKGKSWQDEIATAQQDWAFDCTPIPSKTNADSSILCIKGPIRRGP